MSGLRQCACVASALVVLTVGCASAPHSPYFGDEQYLHFGVDPRDEANVLIKSYAERSEPLAQRIVGRDFTALGFMDRSGITTRARIVTARGIVVALDPSPGSSLQAAVRYALLAAPVPDTQDADGDGFEEVFIEARTRHGHCVSVYRVRDVGFVDAVPTSLALFGTERCATAVEDLDHDGRAELIADIPLSEFELAAPPTVRAVLWADRHRYVLHDAQQRQVRDVAQQAAARELELDRAREAGDVQTQLRLAVELAALMHLLERPLADQLARFDVVLAGARLGAPERAWAKDARERISRDWARDDAAPQPGSPSEG